MTAPRTGCHARERARRPGHTGEPARGRASSRLTERRHAAAGPCARVAARTGEQDVTWMLSSRGSQCPAPARRARSALPQAWPPGAGHYPCCPGKEPDARGTARRSLPAEPTSRRTVLTSADPKGRSPYCRAARSPDLGSKTRTQPSATGAAQDHSTPPPRGSGGTTANLSRSGG